MECERCMILKVVDAIRRDRRHWPETIDKTFQDIFNKGLIWMVYKQTPHFVDFDRCLNFENFWPMVKSNHSIDVLGERWRVRKRLSEKKLTRQRQQSLVDFFCPTLRIFPYVYSLGVVSYAMFGNTSIHIAGFQARTFLVQQQSPVVRLVTAVLFGNWNVVAITNLETRF